MSEELPVLIDPGPLCCGAIGFIFGHKFQPRYDEHSNAGSPPLEQMKISTGMMTDETLCDVIQKINEAYRSRQSIYIGDVCVRCGMRVSRKLDFK